MVLSQFLAFLDQLQVGTVELQKGCKWDVSRPSSSRLLWQTLLCPLACQNSQRYRFDGKLCDPCSHRNANHSGTCLCHLARNHNDSSHSFRCLPYFLLEVDSKTSVFRVDFEWVLAGKAETSGTNCPTGIGDISESFYAGNQGSRQYCLCS